MRHFSEITEAAERVVDAAESLIQRNGYNGFSYDDVSRLIGIKKPSIHHHFPTKAELVAVVAQRYSHRFHELLLHIDSKTSKAPAKLLAYTVLFSKTYEQDRKLCVCGMLGAEAETLPSEVLTEVNRFFKLNVEWLTTVIKAGKNAKQLHFSSNAESQAKLFFSALEGAMVVGRGLSEDGGPGAIAETLVKNLQA
jgi:TetR/AcrR family transcriptional regulator, transcriptional repressor for nem operon